MQLPDMVTPVSQLKSWSLLFLGLLAVVPLARADTWDELVAADRAFAAAAEASSLRAAYLGVLASDAVGFAPGPAPARAIWETRPEAAPKRVWAPTVAEVALSGDLGYTYGPWHQAPADPETDPTFGHTLSVWQRQADGQWRLLADHSVDHGEFPLPESPRRQGGLSLGDPDPGPLYAPGLTELREADLLVPGFLEDARLAPDALALRDNARPAPRRAAPAFKSGPTARVETGAVISRAGDLAVTWGGSRDGPTWLRVWRRPLSSDPPGLGWRLAVDLARPSPPPPERDSPEADSP